MSKIFLGGGCFWCTEAQLLRFKGINKVTSGYAGGKEPNPTYQDVSSGNSGHAEGTLVEYDESKLSLEQLLDIFFTIHDPTTLNQQGADKGTQYRSIIMPLNSDLQFVKEYIAKISSSQIFDRPITTEVKELDNFYPAEEYHQNFFEKNPFNGYCNAVINPKLAKLKEMLPELLK
jgi:methionine-S-sulfoxide reductase